MQCSAVLFPRSFLPLLSLSVLSALGCGAVGAASAEEAGLPDASAEAPAPLEPLAMQVMEVAPPTTPVSPPASPTAWPSPSACAADMVLVEGDYCPDVKQTCLRWLDEGRFWNFRCAAYGKPACASAARTPMRFCIDRYEYTKPGEKLPEVHHSWTSAGAVCASQGKRLCLESEWQFACEGPEMHAYPYGDGFHRSAATCNIDRSNLGKPNSGLRDLRAPADAHPQCVSPFGVYDMSGNVEEWTTLDHPSDPRDTSSMKGAWWLPGRNHCRAATTGHGHTYEGGQVGVRCCADLGP